MSFTVLFCNPEDVGNLFQNPVDVGVETGALLLVLLDQLLRWEDFFFLVRVATEVEVEAAGFDILGTVALRFIRVGVRVLNLDAVLPPVADRIEVLELHRLRLREVLIALRHVEAVEPGLLCRVRPLEEEDVRGDRGIRGEYAARHADDGM